MGFNTVSILDDWGPPILGNHHLASSEPPKKKSPTSLGQLAALPNASFEVTASAMART
jgi:hypothetical protein